MSHRQFSRNQLNPVLKLGEGFWLHKNAALYLKDRERDLDRLRDLIGVSTLTTSGLLQFLLGLRDTLLDLYSLSFRGKGEREIDLDLRGEYCSSSRTLLCLCLWKTRNKNTLHAETIKFFGILNMQYTNRNANILQLFFRWFLFPLTLFHFSYWF